MTPRPQTMEEVLKDSLERHREEEKDRAEYVEREGETDICRGCFGKIEPEKRIPFCGSCRHDGNDVRYALCTEVLRLQSLLEEMNVTPSQEKTFRYSCYACGEKHPEFRPGLSEDEVYVAMYEGQDENGCRAIVICNPCMEKGDFDMWTDEREWDSKQPLVPYRLLPVFNHDDPDRENVTKYPSPQELLKAKGQ